MGVGAAVLPPMEIPPPVEIPLPFPPTEIPPPGVGVTDGAAVTAASSVGYTSAVRFTTYLVRRYPVTPLYDPYHHPFFGLSVTAASPPCGIVASFFAPVSMDA